MSNVDVTSLSISVASTGIREAATALEALSTAATNVEAKAKTIQSATSGLSASQQQSVANIEKLIAGFQKQVDLLGASTSQTNAYTASMKGASQLEQQMAAMLGAEVDAYKAKALAQVQAIKDNNALDASYKKLQQEADAYYASLAKNQARGNALNDAGFRAEEYKKLGLAQAEAIRMNNEMNASMAAQKAIQQARDVELHAMSYQKLAAAQAEAIRMNNAYDASLRRLAQDEAAKKQSIFNNTLQQGHDLARGLSGSLGALWLTYGNIGMMIAGVAIGASLKEAVTGFAKVEYQMTFVKALAEDTTHSVEELTARMHDVAGALGIAPEAAAKGLRALSQAGLSTVDALATLPVAFKLATVGELALEQAALAATGVMNAYDLKVKDLEHIGDVMAKAGAMSAASVDSISVSMKYSAGTAEQYGVSLEKLGTILTLLGKRGITGSSAGVAANNLIAELYSPSSEKAIKAAAALGVKAYVDGVRQPIEDVVASFKTNLGRFDAEGQGMLMEAMFGKKGGKAMYALMGATKEEFQAMNKQLQDSTGFTAEVYKANLKTVEGQLNLTKSAITNMFSKVGEESSQPIKDLLLSIRSMANSQAAQDMFVGLTQSIKTFVTTIVPAALAVGGFFAAVKIGTVVVTAASAAMAFLESAVTIGLIPAIKALNIAMLSNPFTLIIGLVATLAAGYMLLKRNKESVHDLHKKDMEQAAETLKAGNDEIAMLEKQLSLRGKNIRGDGEMAAIKELQAGEAVQKIRQKIIDNNTKYYEALGKSKNSGSFNASGPLENVQLEKDLAEAQKTYGALSEQSKKIQELKARVRAEDKRLDDEEAKDAAKRVTGSLKYNGNEKGAAAAARDSYMEAIKKQDGIIKASKTEMQNFEDTQNNLYKAGEIGKLKFIQDVGAKQVEELKKQKVAINEQLEAAQGKKNGKADTQKFSDEIGAVDKAIANAKLKTTEETNVQLAQYAEENTRFQIKELEAQGKFAAVAALKFSSENKLAFKQAEKDLTDFGDKFPEIEDRYIQLQQAAHAAIVEGKNKEALRDFNTEADKVRNLLKGVQTASEGQGLAAMFEAAQAASAKYAEELPTLKAMMADITDPKGQEEAFARMTQNAESYRKMWVGIGDTISHSLKSAFGNGGEAAGKLIKIAQDYNNLEVKSGSARIKSYGDAAGAAKNFFKEGTTGYKVLEGAERAFRALELAGMVASLAKSLTTDAAKAAGKAPAVFMEFMAQMGPWGMAAAGAAMAAVGVAAFGGGGGGGMSSADRQKTQGTGSVLGMPDAKSESIVNSLSILEKNSGLGLAHSNTMIYYLRNVSNNISNLASAIVRNTGITGKTAGDTTAFTSKTTTAVGAISGASIGMTAGSLFGPIGTILGGIAGALLGSFANKALNSIFGGSTSVLGTGFTMAGTTLGGVRSSGTNASQYTDTKTDGGWFRSDKYNTQMSSLGASANDQFSKTILSMGEVVKAAGASLGVSSADFITKLEQFPINIGKIDLKGLSGDEIQKQLEAVFSKLGDDMVKYSLSEFAQFSKVGEGLLETVARLSNNLTQVKDVFAVLGKSFSLTGVAAVTVSESLIAAAGGMDKLADGTRFFVENFLTEAEKMAPVTASVVTEMTRLGYSNVMTIESFSKLVRSLDLTDPASQKLYASLMDIAPAFKESADYAQKLADGTSTLTKAQQKALDAVTKAKGQLQDSYNSESSALQGTIDKTKAFISTLKNYQDGLKLGADSPLTNMQKYAEARKQFDATAAAANGGDQAAKDKFTQASSALLAASKLINASGSGYTSDFNMVQNAIDTLMGSAGTQVDVAQASLNALNASVAGLIDINKSVMSVTDAIVALQNAIVTGSAQGLSGTQMGTTYTPTPAQIAAATTTSSGSAPIATVQMVEQLTTIVGEVKSELQGLRTDNAAQTGALVGATVKSSEDNAETIATAVTSGGGKNWKLAQIELV